MHSNLQAARGVRQDEQSRQAPEPRQGSVSGVIHGHADQVCSKGMLMNRQQLQHAVLVPVRMTAETWQSGRLGDCWRVVTTVGTWLDSLVPTESDHTPAGLILPRRQMLWPACASEMAEASNALLVWAGFGHISCSTCAKCLPRCVYAAKHMTPTCAVPGMSSPSCAYWAAVYSAR